MSLLKEISITDLSNLRIGHTSDHDAKTGVTVLYFPNGAKAAEAVLLPEKLLSPLLSLPTILSTPLSCPEVLPMDWLLLTV